MYSPILDFSPVLLLGVKQIEVIVPVEENKSFGTSERRSYYCDLMS